MAVSSVILYLSKLDDQVLAVLPSDRHPGPKVVQDPEDPESDPREKFRTILVVNGTVEEFADLMAGPLRVDGVPTSSEKRRLVINLNPGQQNVMNNNNTITIGNSNSLMRTSNPKAGG